MVGCESGCCSYSNGNGTRDSDKAKEEKIDEIQNLVNDSLLLFFGIVREFEL